MDVAFDPVSLLQGFILLLSEFVLLHTVVLGFILELGETPH